MKREGTSQKDEKNTDAHLAAFEKRPEKKKELMKLKQWSEKATGHQQAKASKKISEPSDT
jgi:hypothetical protein